MLGIGISTWRNWYNIGSNTSPFVDRRGNNTPDYETFLIRDTDTYLLETWTVDLDPITLVDIQPVNQP